MGFLDIFKRKKKSELVIAEQVEMEEYKFSNGLSEEVVCDENNLKEPMIRLFYIALEKFKRYGSNDRLIGETYTVSSVFKLPKGMSYDSAYKVISYLSEKVEKEKNIEPASEESVAVVSNLLSAYGFEKIEGCKKGHFHAVAKYAPQCKITASIEACKKLDGVVDLFTVGGHFNIFQNSEFYCRYFDWFSEGVKKQEVEDIYKKIAQMDILERIETADRTKE